MRSVIPRLGVVVLTHEAIPGLMTTGMTMDFEVYDPKVLDGLTSGDSVRFTVRLQGERLRVVTLEKIGNP